MITYRCYNIVACDNDSNVTIPDEYTVQIGDCDRSIPLERNEHLGILCDALVAASGANVESFQYQEVNV